MRRSQGPLVNGRHHVTSKTVLWRKKNLRVWDETGLWTSNSGLLTHPLPRRLLVKAM